MAILASQSDSVRACSGTWQHQMKMAIRDIETLRQRLDLPAGAVMGAKSAKQFPVFVPLPFLERMKPGDMDDPLLRQVMPVPSEDESPAHYSTDPLGEARVSFHPGVLQKYAKRVLLVATGVCAVHCRYCFRRHFPYQEASGSLDHWDSAIEKIAGDSSLEEVILSGGDPMLLVDGQLARLVEKIESVKHLKRLRIHTRLPIMIPQRVTSELIELLSRGRLHKIVVLHSNHANEFDNAVGIAIKKLLEANVTLLNQAVLLRGINDTATALIDLSQQLLNYRVIPYYLHQLDPVVGAAHFEVSKERGIDLIHQMRASLPGYAVPRFVKEIEGEAAKTILA